MNHTIQQPPLVSIALATYNGERYLQALLDSLSRQTYPHIEVIISDDASTDATPSILQVHASQHPNVTLCLNNTNVGYVRNFERAFRLCSGNYIAPCDQDDVWMPHKIQRLVDNIGQSPLLTSDSIITDSELRDTGKKISDAIACHDVSNCLEYTLRTNVYGHTCLFTKKLLAQCGAFHPPVSYDSWLGFNATLTGGTRFLNEPLTYYRQHDTNVASVTGRKMPKRLKRKADKRRNEEIARTRIKLYYDTCPTHLVQEKEVLRRLNTSYQSFSLRNNFLRMITFFQNYRLLLGTKKKSDFHKLLFCIKMFWKIQ